MRTLRSLLFLCFQALPVAQAASSEAASFEEKRKKLFRFCTSDSISVSGERKHGVMQRRRYAVSGADRRVE